MECILAPETVEGSSSQPPAPNPAAGPPAPAAASAPLEQQADLLSLLSVEGARRTAGSLCGIVSQFAGVEGLVGLHGGLPPTSSFPLTSLQFGLADGRTVQLSGTQLAAAQQYNLVLAGYPPLLAWAKAHVQQLHAPPGPLALLITDGASHGLEVRSDGLPGAWGWGLLLASRTCTLTASDCLPLAAELERVFPASCSAVLLPGRPTLASVATTNLPSRCHTFSLLLQMVCSLFLDSGDWVVAEEYTYPQLLECQLAPRGCHVLPVPIDGSGMLPAELERVSERAGWLDGWCIGRCVACTLLRQARPAPHERLYSASPCLLPHLLPCLPARPPAAAGAAPAERQAAAQDALHSARR